MDLFENDTHSFVVKISVEEEPEEMGKQLWQGEITHVSTGSQYLFTQWEKMEGFLRSYLKGTKLSPKPQFVWNKERPYSPTQYLDD